MRQECRLMVHVLGADWGEMSRSDSTLHQSLHDRMDTFAAFVGAADRAWRAASSSSSPSAQKEDEHRLLSVCFAPEYLFSRPRLDDDATCYRRRGGSDVDEAAYHKVPVIDPLSRSEKFQVYRCIEKVSKCYPQQRIYAGTILYKKYTKASGCDEIYNVCAVAEGGRIVHKLYKQHGDDNTARACPGARWATKRDDDGDDGYYNGDGKQGDKDVEEPFIEFGVSSASPAGPVLRSTVATDHTPPRTRPREAAPLAERLGTRLRSLLLRHPPVTRSNPIMSFGPYTHQPRTISITSDSLHSSREERTPSVTIGVDICMDYVQRRMTRHARRRQIETPPHIHAQLSGSDSRQLDKVFATHFYVHADQGLRPPHVYRVCSDRAAHQQDEDRDNDIDVGCYVDFGDGARVLEVPLTPDAETCLSEGAVVKSYVLLI